MPPFAKAFSFPSGIGGGFRSSARSSSGSSSSSSTKLNPTNPSPVRLDSHPMYHWTNSSVLTMPWSSDKAPKTMLMSRSEKSASSSPKIAARKDECKAPSRKSERYETSKAPSTDIWLRYSTIESNSALVFFVGERCCCCCCSLSSSCSWPTSCPINGSGSVTLSRVRNHPKKASRLISPVFVGSSKLLVKSSSLSDNDCPTIVISSSNVEAGNDLVPEVSKLSKALSASTKS
mmetsp:Transcript_20259/g.30055  ORF Transcript_20259/g.30055 Transcript_20259/m.30055 type:complete len:233 (-) Transcript_20259:772-1470(-)